MITFIKSGLLASVQDLGRYGYQKYGVIAGGVMDQFAHRLANVLVGNEETDSTIEITLIGPEIEFNEDSLIAICGADLAPVIDDKPVGLWKPVFIEKGSVLKFRQAKKGCRAYLSIAGGLQVPDVLESKTTYLRAGIGGFHGRALEADDQVPVGEADELSNLIMERLVESRPKTDQQFIEANWSIAHHYTTTSQLEAPIRVMEGRQYDLFTEESKQRFTTEIFKVTPQSDRMGYRLNGPALSLKEQKEMISEPVSFGTIQVPFEGNPILLMADRQTTGGYPKIAEVVTVDLPRLAQLKPGNEIQFEFISHEQAQQLYIEREALIRDLNTSILLKVGRK